MGGEAPYAFNRVLSGSPTMDQFPTAFGQIAATANSPRQIQVVLRAGF